MYMSSPTKRRKTRGSYTMAPKSKKGKEKAELAAATWPPRLLPVELFTIIISYLPRSSIQNMRLVNKEFEKKVSEYLFRVVVVPFKPEIYGITPEPSFSQASRAPGDELRGAIMLQDKGMRVFQGFGRHILRFAMSFEFDMEKLAKPPPKNDHDTITAFWGVYQWPFKKYNRYAQLEGLEQTADETRTMARALRYITNATELGLSIDGGLGWLSGPDTNQRVIARGEKLSVFGSTRFVPEPRAKAQKSGKAPSIHSNRVRLAIGGSDRGVVETRYSMLQRLLRESGYSGDILEHSLGLLLGNEAEQVEVETSGDDTETLGNTHLFPSFQSMMENRFRTTANPALTGRNARLIVSPHDDSDEDWASETNDDGDTTKGMRSKSDTQPFKPNDLTSAQKEMLLEIEWAQRAFMQSYAIAIIDNPSTFVNIETLTIARLPNRHLPILRRSDFWDSLPQLKSLSLAIIPDWRDVVKLPTSWVQDKRVVPSMAVGGVFQLFHQHISHRENIKSLHFEWLSGGEYSAGLFSRNQHILVAPVVSKQYEMVDRIQQPTILSLPHVEHLSLKNCWLSPHIFTQFFQTIKKHAIHSLTLDSVSLSAPIVSGTHPAPIVRHNQHHNNHNNAVAQALMANAVQANQNPNPPAPVALGGGAHGALTVLHVAGPHHINHVPHATIPPQSAANNPAGSRLDWLAEPRHGSWTHIIELLTPGTRLSDMRYSRDPINEKEPPPSVESHFRRLEFKSCGYVRLPLDFDQTALDEPIMQTPTPSSALIAKRMNDLESVMMKPHDTSFGTISNHIDDLETSTLENAWNMTVGWGADRDELRHEAHFDGISRAGCGRFDGIIEIAPPSFNEHNS